MNVLRKLLLGLCGLALLSVLAPGAKASEWDQKVVGTFNAPFAIPGQVLPTGTYVFKILNVMGTRDVVQVSNSDESKVLATAFTIPRYRTNPEDKAIFMLEERGSDSPQALKAWFYPGYIDGHEFVYPKTVATISSGGASYTAAPTPPPSSEAAPAPSASEESAAVAPEEPQVNEPSPDVTAQNTQITDPIQTSGTSTTPAPPEKELPKTGSTTPLIALIGLLSLAGAAGLKTLVARLS